MIKEETNLTAADVAVLKSVGRIQGERLFILIAFTVVTIGMGALLLAASGTMKANFFAPVGIAFLLLFSLCYFMWRGVWLMRRRSNRDIRSGRKGIVEITLQQLTANDKRGLDYISVKKEIYRVAVPLPRKTAAAQQLPDFYPGQLQQGNGVQGETVQLHISGGGVLLQAVYPAAPSKEKTEPLTEEDKRIIKRAWLTGGTSGTHKLVVSGKLMETLVTRPRKKGYTDTYYRVGDKLYLIKPLEIISGTAIEGQQVVMHFLLDRNGQPGRMLYLLCP